jgi:hypothetical protein
VGVFLRFTCHSQSPSPPTHLIPKETFFQVLTRRSFIQKFLISKIDARGGFKSAADYPHPQFKKEGILVDSYIFHSQKLKTSKCIGSPVFMGDSMKERRAMQELVWTEIPATPGSGGTEEVGMRAENMDATRQEFHWTTALKVPLQALLLTLALLHSACDYCPQITSWSLRGANVLTAVRGEYRAWRWKEDFLLVSDKETWWFTA